MIFIVLICLLNTFIQLSSSKSIQSNFDEYLFIKPLPSGHVYTHFQFTIKEDLEASNFQHFRLFPRSLGEVISEFNVQELHLSLSQGLWRYEKWGYPGRSAPPGAELWTIFKDEENVDANWKSVTNILSGQFCASLNFIDGTNTVVPVLSFRPEGAVVANKPFNSSFTRYSSLPRENICTENLTPFRKLLPCGYQAGLSTLLNALYIFKAHFVSLAVDVKSVCQASDCVKSSVELQLSASIVFDPVSQYEIQDWSMVRLFGTSLTGSCPVATQSSVFVDISSNLTGANFILTVEPSKFVEVKRDAKNFETPFLAIYDLKALFQSSRYINIGATYKKKHIYGIIPMPVLHVDRKITGYGQEEGGISCTFYNSHPKSLKVVYFDMIPWYLRLYSHTLSVKFKNKAIKPEYFHYRPAKDRSRPHHLELALTLPPNSKVVMNIEFDFAFLKWTEYPPDANHGFYVGSAVVSVLLNTNRNSSTLPHDDTNRNGKGIFQRIYTQVLLVTLPTPDFSMPYNVICLTCTVVALAFGPIHNITTKSLQVIEEGEEENHLKKIKGKILKWWKSRNTERVSENTEETKKTQ